MITYKFLKVSKLDFGGYFIVPFRREDIFKIKEWRNEQFEVLRQKRILTDIDQLNYYQTIVEASFSDQEPSIILFSYLDNRGQCIGYGGLTNVDWVDKRAEISFIVDTKRTKNSSQYQKDFSCFLECMKMLAFNDLKFNRIFTETYDIRPFHISILEKNGFRLEGRMKEHVYISGKFVDSLLHGYLKSYYEPEK